MDEDVRRGARDLVARLSAADEADMDRVALGWIVISHDDEIDSLYVMGLFATPEEATAFAVRHGEQMNSDLGDDAGWTMTVHRLMPVDK